MQTFNQRAENVRNERNQLVARIIGQQANLGAVSHDGLVRLCNEVSRNHNRPEFRRQVIGDVSTEN